uniref:CD209 antigen-like isoform X4 n=1 Tax=Gasterosteus aculeatus aculeatus TaxID=481459 RepID=UPI001A99451B|nr:CD209 antigen-like isoform X4 [Gasterosteus aculeatus aculeatus]
MQSIAHAINGPFRPPSDISTVMEDLYVEYDEPVNSNPRTNQTAMDEIYANVEYVKSQASVRPSTPAPGPSSPRSRPHVAVAVSLGLLSVLLLAGLVCLGVLMHVSGDKLSLVSAERDQLKDNFTALKDNFTALKDNFTALKDNFTALKDNFTALTQEKDGLQLLLKQKKTCPEGWTMFRGSCYLLSTRDGSWENGRKDCRDQGADLVIIDSLEEQKFLSSINRRRSWIGLSDKDIEGTWKWIDGTPLTAAYWYRDANVVEPNNGGGGSTVEEDCAEMNPDLKTQNSWNDLPCNTALRWIYSQPVAVSPLVGCVLMRTQALQSTCAVSSNDRIG